jgi:RHS repeat-associated protein
MLTVQYPGSTYGSAGPNLGYAYDTMGRLNTMTDLAAQTSIISATTYDPASRLLSITGQYYEGRSYNPMGQLIALSNNAGSMAYSYSATQNNGKITSATDISGEQVVYTYDSLNRLASATATSNAWGQSYSYDGFGNLTDQIVTAGSAPALSTGYNASTNQQPSDCADANGNVNGAGGPFCSTVYVYDVSNRIVSLPASSTQYAYAPGNKRVWRGASAGNGVPGLTLDEVTFWSVTGQKLATYNITGDPTVSYTPPLYTTPVMVVNLATSNYYFGHKLIKNGSSVAYVGSDRLGSIGKYYPWGQEKPSATTNGTEKFTGYFRDAETGNDYAKNRYHQPGMGRFMTPDPYMAAAGGKQDPRNPGSWNQYAYVQGDPVNYVDSEGLYLNAPPGNNPCTPPEVMYKGGCVLAIAEPGGGLGGGGGGPSATLAPLASLDDVTQAFNLAYKALGGSLCASQFNLSGAGQNPADLLQVLLYSGEIQAVTNLPAGVAAETEYLGPLSVTTDTNYYTSTTGQHIQSPGAIIAINITAWNSASIAQDAQTLIHELGHVFDMMAGAGGSSWVYDANPVTGAPDPAAEATNAALDNNCIKTQQ